MSETGSISHETRYSNSQKEILTSQTTARSIFLWLTLFMTNNLKKSFLKKLALLRPTINPIALLKLRVTLTTGYAIQEIELLSSPYYYYYYFYYYYYYILGDELLLNFGSKFHIVKLQYCHGNLAYVSVSRWRRSFKCHEWRCQGLKNPLENLNTQKSTSRRILTGIWSKNSELINIQ